MAGTKPRMTKQHTRAAALPGKPCFPTGAARCKRHPDSGAAGSAGALFCTRALSFASENDLMQVLGLDLKTADADACRIEHVISEETFQRIRAHIQQDDRIG